MRTQTESEAAENSQSRSALIKYAQSERRGCPRWQNTCFLIVCYAQLKNQLNKLWQEACGKQNHNLIISRFYMICSPAGWFSVIQSIHNISWLWHWVWREVYIRQQATKHVAWLPKMSLSGGVHLSLFWAYKTKENAGCVPIEYAGNDVYHLLQFLAWTHRESFSISNIICLQSSRWTVVNG